MPDRFLVEIRAELQGDTLVGHASVFGQLAPVAGGYEEIARTAFDDALKSDETDVRALVNHDPTMVLGRQSAGTLRLITDDRGLRFEADLPDTTYANDLRELVRRGDITGASFGFIPGENTFRRAPDGKQIRTHTSVARLLDVSAVTWPAYEGAGVALRHITFSGRTVREQTIRARARMLKGTP